MRKKRRRPHLSLKTLKAMDHSLKRAALCLRHATDTELPYNVARLLLEEAADRILLARTLIEADLKGDIRGRSGG